MQRRNTILSSGEWDTDGGRDIEGNKKKKKLEPSLYSGDLPTEFA